MNIFGSKLPQNDVRPMLQGNKEDGLFFVSPHQSSRAEQSKFLQLDRVYLLRTTGQAAPLLGTSSSSLLRWIHEGKLPAVRMGKLHYVVEEFPSSGRV
jgi:excisionase family DNA binding protein